MAYSVTNGTLSWNNLVDSATVTGGSWDASYPVTNVQDRALSLKAVTANTDEASMIILVDLGSVCRLEQTALIDTNAEENTEYRITYSTASDFSVETYNTGATFFYPSVYLPSELEFEDDNWWSGTYSPDELANEQKNLYVTFDAIYARYIKIEIFSMSVPFSIGRLFIPKTVWQFDVNYNYGATMQLESSTVVDTSLGKVDFFEVQPQTKVFTFELAWMQSREAHARAYEVMRSQDVHGEVLLLPDKTDTLNVFRNSIYGRLAQLNALTAYQFGYYSTTFQIRGLH